MSKTVLPADLAQKRKVRVPVAAALNAMSESAFRANYSHLIVKIAPRVDVVDLDQALAIGKTPTAA
jgi:hypothetical protein